MAAGVEGVAFTEAAGSEEGATEGAVFLDGFDAVVGAGGVEAAIGAEEGADCELVEAYEEDHKFTT